MSTSLTAFLGTSVVLGFNLWVEMMIYLSRFMFMDGKKKIMKVGDQF